MAWSEIQQLPDELLDFKSEEFKSLKDIWFEQKERISKINAYDDFIRRLNREWAIETGLIEGLYSLNRGITQSLIEQGFDAALIPHASEVGASKQQVIALLRDQEGALEGLFDFVNQNRQFTPYYIKELHAQLTANQDSTEGVDSHGNIHNIPLIKGDWKASPNNPTRADGTLHYYAPPEHVSSEMERLCASYCEYEEMGVSVEVLSAWLHHRFTQIHPFQDGNGRVARAISSLVLIKNGLFPFTVHLERREKYIAALETADSGDLRSLIEFIALQQGAAIRKALSIAEQIETNEQQRGAILEAAVGRLRDRYEAKESNYEKVFDLQVGLSHHLNNLLGGLKSELDIKLNDLGIDSFVNESHEDNSHYYNSQLIDIANQFGYFANWKKFHKWHLLGIKEKSSGGEDGVTYFLVISIHPLGRSFSGSLTATGFSLKKSFSSGNVDNEGPSPLCEAPFTFHYNQDQASLLTKFEPWADEVLRNGLAEWQRGL